MVDFAPPKLLAKSRLWQCAYNVTLWRVHLTIVEMRYLFIVELRVSINNIEILRVAQQCFMANLCRSKSGLPLGLHRAHDIVVWF